GEGIDINGSALSGSYSGVFLGNSVNLTAVGDINIIGHSSGPANRAYGSPDAGVYLSGRGSTLSAANINISGYNPQLKNSAGIIIGQTDVVNTPGASFTFNGNTSLYGDGGAFGIDLGVKSPNTLVFNNGNVSLTGIQRGPRDVQGTGGISAVSINAGGTLQSVNNIVTSNVSHFTINGTTGSADSRVPGIGTAGLNNQVDIINNIKINFSGQVGRLDIKGTANSGSAVNTQVFNASSLNATEGIFIQGESKSGTGVVLSQGDYSNNKVNIVGKSTSGNAVRLDNNTSLANASISGTSDTGSGVVFNGATHNLTDVTVTGQTGGATGNGILINGLTGTNVSIQGTSNGTSGIGINLAGPVQLSGNTRLDGESPTGTGLRVVQKVDVGAGSKVTLAGTSTSGTGVALRNSVNGGSVNGTSGSGAGVVLGDNAKVTSTGIFGQSTSGTGVSIEGKVSLDEASAGLLNATSDSGAGLGLRNNTVLGVVQNGGVTPVTVPVVLTGTSQTGSGVATSGNVSISGVTLKGTSTVDGSAGVTLGGKLTVADDISGVAASATGNGTALVINGAVDAKGYTEAGKDFVIGATVNGDGTAISVSGNSSLSNVALNGTATGNGSAVVVSGSLSTDKTLTATSQGQEGTGLQLSGGHLQGTTADDSPVKVVVSAAGDGTAVSVTKSDTGQSGSGLSGITLVASADRGPVLDIAGDLVTDADISVSTEHGTAISLNGGSLQGADAGHPVTVTAGATGSGTAVIVKPVAEGQPGSTLANVTLNVTSVQGDALNVEGKLNTKDVSVAAATTGTGTALNVSGGEIHSLGGTDITATSDSGHAAVVKDGKFTGDSSGGLEVTATTTTDSPALNISGTSEVSNSVLSGKNSGNGSAVTVAGTVTSSGGGEIKGQTVNGIAVETADGTSVTAAQDGGLLINATATGDKGTGVVLTNATLTGSGVHADVTQGDAVTVTGSLTGGKVSGHANGGTGLNISNAVLTNTSLSGTTQTGTGTAISGTLTGDKTSQVTGVATQDGGTGVTVSGSVTGGKVDGHATSGAGVSVAEGGSFTDTVVTGDATTGTGLNISNAVLTNTSLSGTTQTGTGTAISGTLTGDKTSQVTGVATQDGGTGVTVSGSVTGGKVDGHATSGAGVHLDTGTTLNNVAVSGGTESGKGVDIAGGLVSTGTTTIAGHTTGTGTGVDVAGDITGGSLTGNADGTGTGVTVSGQNVMVSDVVVSGNTEEGTGVLVTGGLSGSGTTVNGQATGGGTGVQVNGTLATDISGSSSSGTGVLVSDGANIAPGSHADGSSVSGTGAVTQGNIANQGSITGQSGTGTGAGIGGSVTGPGHITGTTNGTGSGVNLAGSVSGGTVAGHSTGGTGVSVTDNSVLADATVSGETLNGTGVHVTGNLTSTGATTVTGTSTGSGTGTILSGNVTGGIVNGHSTDGTGVKIEQNITLDSVTVNGTSTSQNGVLVSGHVESTGTTMITGSSESDAGVRLNGTVSGGSLTGHSVSGPGVHVVGDSQLNGVEVKALSESGNTIQIDGSLSSGGSSLNGQSLSDIVTANIIRQEAYQQQGVISNTERLKHPAVASGYRGQDKPVSVEICTNGECRQIDVGTVDVPVGP
ncbi:hypothetical protein K2T44_004468, partial [Salmonella enterica]|nr:hypothetical protein [Salmonella enterica]